MRVSRGRGTRVWARGGGAKASETGSIPDIDRTQCVEIVKNGSFCNRRWGGGDWQVFNWGVRTPDWRPLPLPKISFPPGKRSGGSAGSLHVTCIDIARGDTAFVVAH